MSCCKRIFAALSVILLAGGLSAGFQEQPDKNSTGQAPGNKEDAGPKKDQTTAKDNKKADEKKSDVVVSVPLKISAEGKPALPSGSSLEWQGLKSCSNETGRKNLNSEGITLVNLPVCTVKLVIFLTGFDTKTVTLDISKDKKKDPIRIVVKHQGPPQVED